MRSTIPTADASTGSRANFSSGASFPAISLSVASFSFRCFRFAGFSFPVSLAFPVLASLAFSFELVAAEDPGVAPELDASSCHILNS